MSIKGICLGVAKATIGIGAASIGAIALGYGLQAAGGYLIGPTGADQKAAEAGAKWFGEAAQKAGGHLVAGGEWTGGVLMRTGYSAGYLFPKWIYEQGYPTAVEFATTQMLEPAKKAITGFNITATQEYVVEIFNNATSQTQPVIDLAVNKTGEVKNYAIQLGLDTKLASITNYVGSFFS